LCVTTKRHLNTQQKRIAQIFPMFVMWCLQI
jgi:hypothetical protein